MRIKIVTIFPEIFEGFVSTGMVRKAIDNKKVDIELVNLRKYAWNSYGAVDDRPYGGDVGMLIRADVVGKCLDEIAQSKWKKDRNNQKVKVLVTSPRGITFKQEIAEEYKELQELIILCGRYEGFDQRIIDQMADGEISIGDYVLTGGEIAAMVITDATIRLIDGVLGKDESNKIESFSLIDDKRLIEHDQYTRPDDYEGVIVPEILKSGDPKKIAEWQKNNQLEKNKGRGNN